MTEIAGQLAELLIDTRQCASVQKAGTTMSTASMSGKSSMIGRREASRRLLLLHSILPMVRKNLIFFNSNLLIRNSNFFLYSDIHLLRSAWPYIQPLHCGITPTAVVNRKTSFSGNKCTRMPTTPSNFLRTTNSMPNWIGGFTARRAGRRGGMEFGDQSIGLICTFEATTNGYGPTTQIVFANKNGRSGNFSKNPIQ